jgi:drug efflux transport system permease protein
MLRVLWRVIVKEFRQLRRDKRMIPAMIVGPVVQLLVLGLAANNDVTNIPLIVFDQDHSTASRQLVDRFTASGYFKVVGSVDREAEIEPPLVTGLAQVALVVPRGFGRGIAGGTAPTLQLIVDGTDSNSGVVGLGYAGRIINAAGADYAAQRLRAAGRPDTRSGIELDSRVWYNPDLKSRWFYVPAVIAMVLMLVTMLLPSMAVVREKEMGTLEQIIVTPIRSWQLIVGKLFPFACIGFFDTVLVSALAVAIFRVPLRGSLLALLLLTVPFLLCTLGFGLFVSTLVRTQQQAMMTSAYLVMVPMIYLSGLIFPIENMPVAIQKVTVIIPLKYYAHILRGVFLKGSGFDVLWPDGAALLALGTVVLTLAALRFRKNLD